MQQARGVTLASGLRRFTHCKSIIITFLVLSVAYLISSSRADHALSEVWSEGDGLQMKYLTNHDDLLSTKGSEMSLGSSEAPTKHTGESHSSGDSSSVADDEASGNSAPSVESGTGSPSEGNEEGADSSRQSERVPVSQQQKQLRQRFNEPPARYRQAQESSQQQSELSEIGGGNGGDQDDADDGSAEGSTQKQQGSSSKYPESESASYGAALEQAEEGGETANVDHGADEQQQPQESPKFRPPGRLFKEAVKMGPAQVQDLNEKSSGQQQDLENLNNEQSEEQNDVTTQQKQAEPNEENNGGGEETGAVEPTGAGEPDFNGPPEERSQNKETASERAFRPRQNMIDFDRLPGASSSSSGQRPTGSESQRPRRPQMVAGGSQRHQQPEKSFAGFYPEQRHHMASAGSTTQHRERLPVTIGGTAAAPAVTRPQGNYFRGLQQPQQQAQSPDNERDNFISPGHFPGSMPHLTQAASEPVADKVPEIDKPASSPSTPSQQQQVASDSSSPVVVHQVSASEQKPQIVTDSPRLPQQQPPPPQVTPQPDAQPESQQIMAPILLSTTTMAPMPATDSEVANANATTTTTAAPSLKRFKFRKYR